MDPFGRKPMSPIRSGWARPIVTLALVALALPARSGTGGLDARLSQAKTIIDRALVTATTPGLIIGVTDRRRLRMVIVRGYADLKGRVPLTRSARFEIGSVSKGFTAIALMQLAQENRFDPHAPISRYLPSFAVHSRFAPITGRALMSHTSGLPNWLADDASSRYAVIALHDFEPTYAPGAHFWYSNTGYQLLGYVLENIDRDRYARIIQRRVLDPMGMSSTSPIIDDAERTRMVVSYITWPYNGAHLEAPWFEYSGGDGNMVSNVADLCAYMRFFLNHGMGDKGRVLSANTFAILTTPILDDYAYGIGARRDPKGHLMILHGGGIAGYRAFVEAHMDEGFGVVFLGNGEMDRALRSWVLQVIASVFDDAPIPATPDSKAESTRADLAQYAGRYQLVDPGSRGVAGTGPALEFAFVQGQLFLESAHGKIPLEPMGADVFRAAGEATDGLPFVFGRGGPDGQGRVTDVSHGALWYATDKLREPVGPDAPKTYREYVGHFANNGPEGPIARVFVRNGRLMMFLYEGGPPVAEPLEPISTGVFRIGSEVYSPERAHFDAVVDGRALRLLITGVPLYRMDTP